MSNNTKRIATTASVIVGVIILIWVMWYFAVPRGGGDYDAFAQCLADKEVTMYGTYSCIYCKSQKAMFENSFSLVPYVECTENPKLCVEKGIEKYPTWIFTDKDGAPQKKVGVTELPVLSELTGCPLAPVSAQ